MLVPKRGPKGQKGERGFDGVRGAPGILDCKIGFESSYLLASSIFAFYRI